VALALRPPGTARNLMLLGSVALNAVLALLAVWWPPTRELLHTDTVAVRDLVPCLLALPSSALPRPAKPGERHRPGGR
jgi:hypothetical protein